MCEYSQNRNWSQHISDQYLYHVVAQTVFRLGKPVSDTHKTFSFVSPMVGNDLLVGNSYLLVENSYFAGGNILDVDDIRRLNEFIFGIFFSKGLFLHKQLTRWALETLSSQHFVSRSEMFSINFYFF
jgi:hypothetical protein